MAIPFSGTIIRGASYLFGFIMRKYYTSEKISSMMKISISSEHTGITVNCSDLPDAKAWLLVTNFSPFPLIVHGVEAELFLAGRVAKFISLHNEKISPSGEQSLFIQTDLTGRQAEHIKRNKMKDRPRLNIKMQLSFRLSSFEIAGRDIYTKNIEFINCNDT